MARGEKNHFNQACPPDRLIAFELGLRFFADYLVGNVYFKVNYPEHNLFRALVQFQLTESIESQEIRLRQLIQKLT